VRARNYFGTPSLQGEFVYGQSKCDPSMRRFMNECDVAIDLSSGERRFQKPRHASAACIYTKTALSAPFRFFPPQSNRRGAFSATPAHGHKGLFVLRHSLFYD
jgi:hypothetical protein